MAEIKRKANAGERIKIVNASFTFGDYANGTEMVVEKRVGDRAVNVEDYGVPSGVTVIADHEYVVIEPEEAAQVTALPDESLGGTLREYREVKRKAAVGELVKVIDDSCAQYTAGKAYVAHEETLGFGDIRIDSYYGGTVHLRGDEYVVLEQTDIVVINGERLRMVDRKAAAGERVIVTKVAPDYLYAVGDVGEALDKSDYTGAPKIAFEHGNWFVGITNSDGGGKYAVLEPVASAEPTPALSELPAQDQAAANIATLALKVAELEKRLLALETETAPAYVEVARGTVSDALPSFAKSVAQGVVDAINDPEVTARRLFGERKSPQQIRDEIVERAKADVNDLLGKRSYPVTTVDGMRRNMNSHAHYVDYVVNREKHTVVAIVKHKDGGRVRVVGKSKCAPDDVFNSHIGRAIALHRALGLEVPAEYLSVPGPEEIRAGDIVRLPFTGAIRTVASVSKSHVTYTTGKSNSRQIPVIIDDSKEAA